MLYKVCAILTKQDDGSYLADVPDMHYCTTTGRSVEEATEMIKDAAGLCLVVMEDNDETSTFLTKEQLESETDDIVVELEIDSDVVRAESDACNERCELVKAMNTIVKDLSDEDAYGRWIEIVPDQADEYDLNDIGCDEELFKHVVELFKDIMCDHMKHGFCIGTKSY